MRLQFDSMQTAIAGIVRSGQEPPPDATTIAMFDNSLPMAYSQIRQLVRRARHESFLAHYTDYVAQVRAELASRTPTAHAFSGWSGTARKLVHRPAARTPSARSDRGWPRYSRWRAGPWWREAITLKPRDDVHVEVKDVLPRSCSAGVDEIDAARTKHLRLPAC